MSASMSAQRCGGRHGWAIRPRHAARRWPRTSGRTSIMPEDLDALSNEQFRFRFRNWLEKSYPPEWRQPIVFRLSDDLERRWLRMLYDAGWRAPAWPKQYGGLGLSLEKQLIYHHELESFGAARFLDSGGVLL